ncbi:MAG: gamma-glutamyltransferase, partial [Rhodospirillaceae bacterium]|nr:gamma-glutamyltransferase [Rhodospirillaceae bacterium]
MVRATYPFALAAGALLLLGACEPQDTDTDTEAQAEVITVVPNYLRPPVMGRNGGVSAGHPLTTATAIEILQNGGNAFDAGVAAILTGGVVEQDLYSLGGESLIL